MLNSVMDAVMDSARDDFAEDYVMGGQGGQLLVGHSMDGSSRGAAPTRAAPRGVSREADPGGQIQGRRLQGGGSKEGGSREGRSKGATPGRRLQRGRLEGRHIRGTAPRPMWILV